jgi:DNA modification methylase
MTLDTIVCGDAVEVLPWLPAGRAHLVFADPPHNLGLAYDVYRDNLGRGDYLR